MEYIIVIFMFLIMIVLVFYTIKLKKALKHKNEYTFNIMNSLNKLEEKLDKSSIDDKTKNSIKWQIKDQRQIAQLINQSKKLDYSDVYGLENNIKNISDKINQNW